MRHSKCSVYSNDRGKGIAPLLQYHTLFLLDLSLLTRLSPWRQRGLVSQARVSHKRVRTNKTVQVPSLLSKTSRPGKFVGKELISLTPHTFVEIDCFPKHFIAVDCLFLCGFKSLV